LENKKKNKSLKLTQLAPSSTSFHSMPFTPTTQQQQLQQQVKQDSSQHLTM